MGYGRKIYKKRYNTNIVVSTDCRPTLVVFSWVAIAYWLII